MKKPFGLAVIGCVMMAVTLVGCSNKPSDEQMKQLTDLKAEVSSLEKTLADTQAQKDALLKAIAEKDAQLAQCAKDKQAVQARLGAK